MDCLALVVNQKFLGIDWHPWKIVGWVGNLVFFSRFIVQWWATERSRQVVIPNAFWWLSLLGSLCLLSYGLWRRDSVFIFAYAFTWIPYVRNLMISYRARQRRQTCIHCGELGPLHARFCPDCGVKLDLSDPEPTSAPS